MPLYNAVNGTPHELEICGSSDFNISDTANIKIFGKISFKEVNDRERERDVLVCICNKHGTQIPGKAYHYAMTDKYILMIVDGEHKEELKRYFGNYNRYIICENNEKSIRAALTGFACDSNLCKPCEAFSVDTIAKRLIE